MFETGRGERIDTFSGLVTKDLVIGPDTTIVLWLTDAELDSIYQKMIEIRFFEYPEPHPAFDQGHTWMPTTTVRLRVKAGSREKELSWNTGQSRPTPKTAEDWKRLRELVRLIQETVQRRPEYRELPSERGGYM